MFVQSLKDKSDIDNDTYHKILNPPAHEDSIPPTLIKLVPRLLHDLKVFFYSDLPLPIVVRSKTVLYLLYGFGDASGKGFGSTMM